MTPASFHLARLRVLWRGIAVYDERFHLGVNIIRGQNSSGKSTIADFIFYVLGGELDTWKGAAEQCEEVQAEVHTRNGTLTVRRPVGTKSTSPFIFFGSLEDAAKSGIDSWSAHALHRQGAQESFSQIMFRAAGIPEAPSDGESNITMHQLLRLAYADQRTPAGKLFRFESWDTNDIREAVGNLMCGLGVYESYGIRLRLRELSKIFEEKDRQLSLKLAAMPAELASVHLEAIEFQIQNRTKERTLLLDDIANVDNLISSDADKVFLDERQGAVKKLNSKTRQIRQIEIKIEKLSYEISDIERYTSFLSDLLQKLSNAEASSEIIGPIEFTHCPSCLTRLAETLDREHCNVCGAPRNPESEKSRYLQIKIDLQVQLRESEQLRVAKSLEVDEAHSDHRKTKREYDTLLAEFTTRYDLSSSPRESFLATRNQKVGQLEREISYLQNLIEIAREISKLSSEKAAINDEIHSLRTRIEALNRNEDKRKREALTLISTTGCKLLSVDLPRQEEFINPQSLSLNFRDDAIAVDGQMNFSESSNVVLKNTAILSLLGAATVNFDFFHPRFLLMDNVEDKGMEAIRSHNFQRLIVSISEQAKTSHQIIFTTSMMNPELEREEYVIGPTYTRENRTLRLPIELSSRG